MPPAPLTLDDRLVIPTSVVSRDLDGETVMLNLESGVYFGLDAIGSVIWTHLQQPTRLRDIRDRLVAEFDVDDDRAAADLLELSEQLVARGLVTLAPPSQP